MRYSVDGVEPGTSIDCGRYGIAISGEIEREDQVTFLRATGRVLVDAARDLPATMISWYSPNYGVADGYGASAEHMIRALEQRGYDIRTEPRWELSGATHIREILDRPFANGSVRIAYTPPNPRSWTRRHPLQALLGFSMWEDSALPTSFDAGFANADALAVPSRFCQRLFQGRLDELGLAKTVHYVPLGVDVIGAPTKRTFHRDHQTFTVIHSASRSSELRKGADIAYAAFRKAFGNRENVQLILRSRLDSFPEEPFGDPRVVFMAGPITDAERTEIFERAHVMLYPSRGEGFGLIPLEAMATGLPAIVSDGSALSEYRELFYPIETRSAPSQISVAVRPEPAGYWHEPDVDAAAMQLRRIYDDYDAAATRGMEAAAIIRQRWTYARSAAALAVAIEDTRTTHEDACDASDAQRELDQRRHAIAHGG